MTDKLRRTHPLNISFADGEAPTASKLTAVASQARIGARLIEKAVGDLWNQSGDSILNAWPLQIPNLARVIGETKYLTHDIYPPTQQFSYVDLVGTKFQYQNHGYLQFKPMNQSVVVAMSGSTNLTDKKTNEADVVNAGDWWVDASTGRYRTFTALSTTDRFEYTVDPSAWSVTSYTVPCVIPDTRQLTFTGCRISRTGSTYFIHLPPRRPLDLTGFERPERYPSTTDISSNEASTSAAPRRLWQVSSTVALQDGHYRYQLPKEISGIISSMGASTPIPEGLIYLWNQNTQTIVDDAVFKALGPSDATNSWVFEITSATEDFESKITSNEQQSSYNSSGYSVITVGSSIARLLHSLHKTIYSGRHDNSGDFGALIDHGVLTGVNPPSASYSGHNSTYPTYIPSWVGSKWGMDHHVSLLNRAGSQVDVNKTRDPYNNAMLGHLILANADTSGANNFLDENNTDDSFKLCFGNFDGPHLYATDLQTLRLSHGHGAGLSAYMILMNNADQEGSGKLGIGIANQGAVTLGVRSFFNNVGMDIKGAGTGEAIIAESGPSAQQAIKVNGGNRTGIDIDVSTSVGLNVDMTGNSTRGITVYQSTATGVTGNIGITSFVAGTGAYAGYFNNGSVDGVGGTGNAILATLSNAAVGPAISVECYGTGNANGINTFGKGTGVGIYALGGTTGYGATIETDTSTPVRAALRIVPQDTQPSGPNLVGDIYVTTAGLLKICTVAGTPGTWVSVGTQT